MNLLANTTLPATTCVNLQHLCGRNTPSGSLVESDCPVSCASARSHQRWLCEAGNCSQPYLATCAMHNNQVWEALFSLNPFDSSVDADYNSSVDADYNSSVDADYNNSFWTDATYELQSQTERLDASKDMRFEGYGHDRSYTTVGVLVSIGGSSYTSLSTYRVQARHLGKSLLELMLDRSFNIEWTHQRADFVGAPVKPWPRPNWNENYFQPLFGDLINIDSCKINAAMKLNALKDVLQDPDSIFT
eukprot:TRINITY_DN6156_c0_g1_i1.p1 TRINITY_DN6156_c0_g1~~TRINITY_DN6156_c0_g1_i1.p1  ORF type:complete len:246 (+),score=44.33 TRINITY_DN6156_c0_g1_i1:341-1078(+)